MIRTRFPEKAEDVGVSSERLLRIGRVLRAEVEAGRIPGAVIAMARRGALVHMEALGYRDASAGVAMTEDTLFWAASMTKPMTVVATLMLHERGELLIDDPMGKY
ncbi:MAG TPA: serine hydrolase domain-containing protein, partial [Polyangiaceae bacterium]|nr:serine hydrolase domain-containing protein [Polyangiaceae bacterium]